MLTYCCLHYLEGPTQTYASILLVKTQLQPLLDEGLGGLGKYSFLLSSLVLAEHQGLELLEEDMNAYWEQITWNEGRGPLGRALLSLTIIISGIFAYHFLELWEEMK